MNIDVTFRHMDSTRALKEHAIERVGVLERYFDQVQDVHIVFSAEKKHHIAEITVHSPGEIFKATASTEDMYSTIDSVMAKLERHFRRRKEIVKINSQKGTRPHFPLDAPGSSSDDDLDDDYDYQDDNVQAFELVDDRA